MKKTLIHTTIAIVLGLTTNSANATNVEITAIDFSLLLAAGGVLLDNGGFGSMHSVDLFKGIPWTADGVAGFSCQNNKCKSINSG